jgi:hypothetical protein
MCFLKFARAMQEARRRFVFPIAVTMAILVTFLLLSSCAIFRDIQPGAPVLVDGTDADEDDPVPDQRTFEGNKFRFDDGEAPPIGLVPAPSGKQFRAATWNIRNWYSGKSKRPARVHPGAATMIETLFVAFEEFDFDVIALQELYVNSGGPQLEVPAAYSAKYSVIYGGQPINMGKSRSEYCPIVFDTTEISCRPGTVWTFDNRGVHWAACHPKDHPDKEFFFGCGHLSPISTRAKANISDFFKLLKQASAGPVFRFGPGGVDRAEFIVGMDANSYYHAQNGLGRRWQDEHARFEPDPGKPLIEFHPPSGPFAGAGPFGGRIFTKIFGRHTNTGVLLLRVNGDENLWIIDDIFWSVSRVTYVPGSKQVVPVQQLSGVSNMTPDQRAAFWEAYYAFSDHLPVKADFQFAE